MPASIRHLNPGAQWPGPIASKWGSTGYETLRDGQGNKIATFPTWEQGAAAHIDLLKSRYSGLPMADAIRKWSGGNFSKEYADRVTRETGIRPDTVITEDLLKSPQGLALVKSMAGHEKGPDGQGVPDEAWGKAYSMVFDGASAPGVSAPEASAASAPSAPAGAYAAVASSPTSDKLAELSKALFAVPDVSGGASGNAASPLASVAGALMSGGSGQADDGSAALAKLMAGTQQSHQQSIANGLQT
ncbi:MAG: hypothetical protein ABL908_11575, partial [Hyphomicrobium sp.]